MPTPYFINAIGSPLTPDESLHTEGLEAHLSDQWNAGINGVLVAGTMGMMQLLKNETYTALATHAAKFSKGKGEVMIGAGDASYHRTLARIQFLNTLAIDAVVVLSPFFINFSQPELLNYYTALASASKAPLFLYDLPQRTHSKIEFETVLQLAKHPNIKGIKCSDDPLHYPRRLKDTLGDSFRVIVAQPLVVNVTLKFGLHEQLDGIYALAPKLTKSIGNAAAKNDWPAASIAQQKLTALLFLYAQYGYPAFTALLNARGIPGNFAPLPYQPLTPSQIQTLTTAPEALDLLKSESPGPAGTATVRER